MSRVQQLLAPIEDRRTRYDSCWAHNSYPNHARVVRNPRRRRSLWTRCVCRLPRFLNPGRHLTANVTMCATTPLWDDLEVRSQMTASWSLNCFERFARSVGLSVPGLSGGLNARARRYSELIQGIGYSLYLWRSSTSSEFSRCCSPDFSPHPVLL